MFYVYILLSLFTSSNAADIITTGLSDHAHHGRLLFTHERAQDGYNSLPVECKMDVLRHALRKAHAQDINYQEIAVFKNNGRVTSLAYDPHSKKRLAVGFVDGTTRIIDTSTGGVQQTLSGHARVESLAYDPHNIGRLASSSYDYIANVWDIPTGKALHVLRGPDRWVHAVAYDPHSANKLALAFDNASVHVWDINTREVLHVFKIEGADRIFSVAYDPHIVGRLAVGSLENSWGGKVRILDIKTGEIVCTLEGHTSSALSVAYDPHTVDRVASGSGDCDVHTWDLNTGRALRVLKGHRSTVHSVAYNLYTKGRLASSSTDGTVRIWDLETGQALRVLKDYHERICALAFDPHSVNRLAAGSDDHTVRLYASPGSMVIDELVNNRQVTYEQLLMAVLLSMVHKDSGSTYVLDVIKNINTVYKKRVTSMAEFRRVQDAFSPAARKAFNSLSDLKGRRPVPSRQDGHSAGQ